LNLFVEHVDNVAHAKTPKIPAQQEIYVDTPERRAATAFAQRSFFFLVVVDMPRVDLPSADLRPWTAFGTVFASAPTLNPRAHRFALVGLPRIPKVWFIFFVCRHGMLV
jgi:hypothetical protein